MSTDTICSEIYVKGEVRLHRVRPATVWDMVRERIPDPRYAYRPRTWTPVTEFESNQFLYEWGAIFGNLLMRQGISYGIGGMYLEFQNVASPGDPVSPPDFTRDASEGIDYYSSLAASSDTDYLRVPLVANVMDSTDRIKFPKGNRPSFFAQTSGLAGIHGKPFSDVNNSTVFGGALVAFVDDVDPTLDLVLSRFYTSVQNQQVKLATSQIGFEWRVTLL